MADLKTATDWLRILAGNFATATFTPVSKILETLKTNGILQTTSGIQFDTAKLGENWQTLLSGNAAVVACIVIGLVHLIIVTLLVQNILLCCCSGKPKDVYDPTSKGSKGKACGMIRKIFGILFALLLLVGAVFLIISNHHLKAVIWEIYPTKVLGILDQVKGVVVSISTAIGGLATSVLALISTVDKDVKSIGTKFIDPLVTEVTTEVNKPFTVLKEIPTVVTSIEAKLTSIKSGFSTIDTQVTSATTKITDINKQLKAAGQPELTVSTSAIESAMGTAKSYVNGFSLGDLSAANVNTMITNAETNIKKLTNEVNTQASTLSTELGKEIGKVKTEAETTLNKVKGEVNKLTSSISTEIDSVKTTVGGSTIKDQIQEYYPIVYWVLIGLSAIIMITTLCWIGGAATNKSCPITFGLVIAMLMGLLFIIFTMIGFLVSGPVHVYVCDSLTAPDYTLITEIENAKVLKDFWPPKVSGLTWDPPLNAPPIKDLITGCSKDQQLWDLLQMQNIKELKVASSFDITSQINQLKGQVNSQIDNVMTKAIQDAGIKNFKTEIDSFSSKAGTALTKAKSVDLKSEITKAKSEVTKLQGELDTAISSATTKGATSVANSLTSLKNTEIATISSEMDKISTLATQLSTDISSLETAINNVSPAVTATVTYVDNLPTTVKTKINTYIDELAAKIPNLLMGDIKTATKCGKIFKVFDDSHTILCKEAVGAFQALWMSISWIAGLLPICWFFFYVVRKNLPTDMASPPAYNVDY